MTILLGTCLAVLAQTELPDSERYLRLAEGVRFPSEEDLEIWRGASRHHRDVIAVLLQRSNWANGLYEIEHRLGIAISQVDVEVRFLEGSLDEQVALGGGRDGVGHVTFNMTKLADYRRQLEEYERNSSRPGARTLVPPTRVDRLIWHELTHVFQGEPMLSPDWLREGMATYVEQNESHVKGFAYRHVAVRPLDEPVDLDNAYARGALFWMWLESREGIDCVHRVIEGLRAPRSGIAEAVEMATGLAWSRAVEDEYRWSRRYIDGEWRAMRRGR